MIPSAATAPGNEEFPPEPEDLFRVMMDDLSDLNGRKSLSVDFNPSGNFGVFIE
jgi:hypothetical protein